MKYVIKNLKISIKEEKTIFFLMIICVITSAFIINFSYGLYQNYNIIKNEAESGLYEIRIQMNNTEDNYASSGEIKETLFSFSESLNDAIDMHYLSFESEDVRYDFFSDVEVRFRIDNGKILPCEIFRENLESQGILLSGRYFTDEQEMNGENVALISDDRHNAVSCAEKLMIDEDTIFFMGKEYKIIGKTKIFKVLVPFNTLDDDIPIKELIFNFSDVMTRSQYNEIKEKIQKNFGEIADIPELDIPEAESYYYYNTIIIIAVLIAVFAAINFAFLYKYILSKRIKSLAVFRICGCTRGKALRIFLSECMVITIPCFIFATLLYALLLLPFFSEYFEDMSDAYSIKIYIILFAAYVISSLIVLTIMISFSFLKKEINVKG